MGLLDDLKRQADRVRTRDSLQRAAKEENLRVVDAAMDRIFRYLPSELRRHRTVLPHS